MGCLVMKNNINIKTRRIVDWKIIKKVVLEIIFIIASLGCGFLVAYFGNGLSFVESDMITAVITLFGFSLTSTVFICQFIKHKENNNVDKLINALAKNLILTFILVSSSLVFDFLSGFGGENVFPLIMLSLKYSVLIYAFLIQIDILLAFITIIKKLKP